MLVYLPGIYLPVFPYFMTNRLPLQTQCLDLLYIYIFLLYYSIALTNRKMIFRRARALENRCFSSSRITGLTQCFAVSSSPVKKSKHEENRMLNVLQFYMSVIPWHRCSKKPVFDGFSAAF